MAHRDTLPTADDVLGFWFGTGSPGVDDDTARPLWFKKDEKVDEEIRNHFWGLLALARAGRLDEWVSRQALDPRKRLARIIVCDQLSRNAFRGSADSFMFDPIALRDAREMIDDGTHLKMSPAMRSFIYMPLMHSEDLHDQDRCVRLCEEGAAHSDLLKGTARFAKAHRDIIARFGRFPHRNEILGRSSTPEEVEFLKGPGSSF